MLHLALSLQTKPRLRKRLKRNADACMWHSPGPRKPCTFSPLSGALPATPKAPGNTSFHQIQVTSLTNFPRNWPNMYPQNHAPSTPQKRNQAAADGGIRWGHLILSKVEYQATPESLRRPNFFLASSSPCSADIANHSIALSIFFSTPIPNS